jgi:hypothetical protein
MVHLRLASTLFWDLPSRDSTEQIGSDMELSRVCEITAVCSRKGWQYIDNQGNCRFIASLSISGVLGASET